jgi:hypothetical protein
MSQATARRRGFRRLDRVGGRVVPIDRLCDEKPGEGQDRAGDAQPLPQEARPEVQAIIAEPDPMRKLARYATMALTISRRVGPVSRMLKAAAAATPTDSGLNNLLSSTEQQRRTGSRGPAERLAALGVLRKGLTVDRAADQIYALTSIEVFERLTDVCGWSDGEYQEWLTRTLADALLDRSTRAATT